MPAWCYVSTVSTQWIQNKRHKPGQECTICTMHIHHVNQKNGKGMSSNYQHLPTLNSLLMVNLAHPIVSSWLGIFKTIYNVQLWQTMRMHENAASNIINQDFFGSGALLFHRFLLKGPFSSRWSACCGMFLYLWVFLLGFTTAIRFNQKSSI